MIIAVDGPAGAGKGTISGYLSVVFNLAHIDSGRIYRRAGLFASQTHLNLERLSEEDVEKITTFIKTITIKDLEDPYLRAEEVASFASKIATIPIIRHTANAWMHAFCENLPDIYKGVVIDGRDIGTAVFPKADGKLFITASEEIRLERRFKESHESQSNVMKFLQERDKRDSTRKIDPLKPAEDAFILDTSDLSIDEACKIASEYVVNSCIKKTT